MGCGRRGHGVGVLRAELAEDVQDALEPERPGLDPRRGAPAGAAAARPGRPSEQVADRLERDLQVAHPDDRARRLELLAPVRAVVRPLVDPRRPQQVQLVVVPQRSDAQARQPGEPSDGQQVVHSRHRGPSGYPRVKGLVARLRRLSSSRSMARRMNRAASALLPPSFWSSSCSSAAPGRRGTVQRRPSARGRRRERRVEPRATAARALSTVWPFAAISSRTSARRRPPRRPGSSSPPADRPPQPVRRSGLDRLRRPAPSGTVVDPRRPRRRARRQAALAVDARQSDSSMLIASSSHQRPSRQIDSRERPSSTNPHALVGADRPLVELEDEQARRDAGPSVPNAWSSISWVASVP